MFIYYVIYHTNIKHFSDLTTATTEDFAPQCKHDIYTHHYLQLCAKDTIFVGV